ncbi:MAG: hypothetical protein ISS45_12135 [Candidatus Omnitrophica bacterium]|nr:hypothetical protein [Candidatus Omnitrophota bacterium]
MLGDLLALPIYSKSYKQYYKNADKEWSKTLRVFEDSWKRAGGSLSEDRKVIFQETYYAPPWKYNAIVGYIQIGWDLGGYITGYIFLKLKHIPKGHYKKTMSIKTTIGNNQTFYFTEISKAYIENNEDNNSIIKSINSITENGKLTLNKINKKWIVPDLPFTLECIDFIKVFGQLRQKHNRQKGAS